MLKKLKNFTSLVGFLANFNRHFCLRLVDNNTIVTGQRGVNSAIAFSLFYFISAIVVTGFILSQVGETGKAPDSPGCLKGGVRMKRGGKWGACCASRIGARRTDASTGGFQMMKCRYKKVF
jgi:hypothetical protein